MNRFFRKQKEKGLITDNDFLIKGKFVRSMEEIGKSVLINILIAIFTLGMLIRTTYDKAFKMAINNERFILFVEFKSYIILREDITNITINKETKKGIYFSIITKDEQIMNLFAMPFNKEISIEQLKITLFDIGEKADCFS